MPKSKLPKWLNIGIGYGVDGMTNGSLNNQIGILEEVLLPIKEQDKSI